MKKLILSLFCFSVFFATSLPAQILNKGVDSILANKDTSAVPIINPVVS